MSILDVRETKQVITEIQWADRNPVGNNTAVQAFRLVPQPGDFIQLKDRTGEFVNINSAESARNLQKALDKAIELGWLK